MACDLDRGEATERERQPREDATEGNWNVCPHFSIEIAAKGGEDTMDTSSLEVEVVVETHVGIRRQASIARLARFALWITIEINGNGNVNSSRQNFRAIAICN